MRCILIIIAFLFNLGKPYANEKLITIRIQTSISLATETIIGLLKRYLKICPRVSNYLHTKVLGSNLKYNNAAQDIPPKKNVIVVKNALKRHKRFIHDNYPYEYGQRANVMYRLIKSKYDNKEKLDNVHTLKYIIMLKTLAEIVPIPQNDIQ